MIQTHQIMAPPPLPSGTDVRTIRGWMNAMQLSVRSCIDAVRAIDYRQTPHAPRDAMGAASGAGIDFSKLRHGYTVSGNTLTLLTGKLKKHGAMVATTAAANFALGGTQYFYVHHVRSSTASAWASAGAEPGVSSTDIDVFFYQFNGTTLVTVGALGDINLDLPLA
jgi:hypothetical protein